MSFQIVPQTAGYIFLYCTITWVLQLHTVWNQKKIALLILLNCEAASLTVFTTMCPKEQQTSENLIVKDYLDGGCFKCLLSTRLSFTYDNTENFLKGRFHSAWLLFSERVDSRRGWVKVYWYSDDRSIKFNFKRQKSEPNKAFYGHRSNSVFLTNILKYRLDSQLVVQSSRWAFKLSRYLRKLP